MGNIQEKKIVGGDKETFCPEAAGHGLSGVALQIAVEVSVKESLQIR